MELPDRLPSRLAALNLLRWLREYIVAWGLLSFIYSLTVTAILQPILEKVLKQEIPFPLLWISTCAILLVPGMIEALPTPPLWPQSAEPRLAVFAPSGIFSEAFWRKIGGALSPLYLRHELRRSQTWIAVLLSVIAASAMPDRRYALWILIAQLPMQRALYSVHRWRKLALAFEPQRGARSLIYSIWMAQILEALVGWLAVGISGPFTLAHWLELGPGVLGATLASGAVALEGDSGRPWLVNFMSLAAGILGGYLCLAWPLTLALVVYFCHTMLKQAANRLHSVEHLDEDALIS